ncbi:M24 family metallopeptidase [Amycolatopsis jejuensis]|uniref:M24 family metallopeptidase n=1 Tax=Amycolatopsis jejuensis TaxID=330084 RepID=UPI000526A2D1|nr:M24 family metallopeptidase [Amycolatopsis jejuensis]
MIEEGPVLSLDERDRRWELARGLMRQHDLACLIVAGLRGRERYDAYLSGEAYEGIVVLPLSGEPTYLVTQAHRITQRFESASGDRTWWIPDARPGVRLGPLVGKVLQERGFARSRIGVVGLRSEGPMEMEGIIPFSTWSALVEILPDATLVEVSSGFAELMMCKSAEEIAAARHAAAIGDLASEAMVATTQVGATDAEIYAAVSSTIFRHGAVTTHPHLLLRSGPDNLGWGPPNWWCQAGGPPRTIAPGDVVLAEIFVTWAGVETQQQVAVAVPPVAERTYALASVARRSYDEGLRAVTPGRSFQSVCTAMDQPLLAAGCWHLSPLAHNLNPLTLIGPVLRGVEELPEAQTYEWLRPLPPSADATLESGMLLQLEPNACLDRYRVNFGGTVLVGKDGVEELNKYSSELHIAG